MPIIGFYNNLSRSSSLYFPHPLSPKLKRQCLPRCYLINLHVNRKINFTRDYIVISLALPLKATLENEVSLTHSSWPSPSIRGGLPGGCYFQSKMFGDETTKRGLGNVVEIFVRAKQVFSYTCIELLADSTLRKQADNVDNILNPEKQCFEILSVADVHFWKYK